MGIKLKKMKLKFKYYLLPLIGLIISCKTQKESTNNENDYIMAYKKAVFYECVNSATNGNLYEFSKKNNDLGTAIEVAVLYHSDTEHAKNIGTELSSKIRTIDYSAYDGRKPIFSDCIEFAFSAYVDSIAKHKYKILKESTLEYKSE